MIDSAAAFLYIRYSATLLSVLSAIPPIIPCVTSDDDTSNFDDFEKVKSVHFAPTSYERNTGFTGKDLPFIGFTFTRTVSSSKKPS